MTKLTLIKNEEATATLSEFISSFGTFGVLGMLGGILFGLVMSLLLSCVSCLMPPMFCILPCYVPFALSGGAAILGIQGWVLDYLVALIKAT